MQSNDSLATELIKTEKSVGYGFVGAKKRLKRLQRRIRRRRRNELRTQLSPTLS